MLVKNARRLMILFAGVVVILVGIAGLVLPVIPGVVLIVVGVAILATEFIWAKHLLNRMKEGGSTIMDKFRNASASVSKEPPPSSASSKSEPLP